MIQVAGAAGTRGRITEPSTEQCQLDGVGL